MIDEGEDDDVDEPDFGAAVVFFADHSGGAHGDDDPEDGDVAEEDGGGDFEDGGAEESDADIAVSRERKGGEG